METVLDTYQRPLDPRYPVVCVDDLSKTLPAHVRAPQAPRAGRAARQDYEYKRNGHRNLCMMTAPCLGWRMVKVTRHRQRPDFAEILKELVDVHFPRPSASRGSATTSTSTSPACCTAATIPPRPAAFARNCSGCTRPSMPAG